jgi:hypothetical protein
MGVRAESAPPGRGALLRRDYDDTQPWYDATWIDAGTVPYSQYQDVAETSFNLPLGFPSMSLSVLTLFYDLTGVLQRDELVSVFDV